MASDPSPGTSVFETFLRKVGDYAGTEYAEVFQDFPADHPVAVAYDPATQLYCALALAEGQSPENASTEARYQLSRYVARHRVDS